ncbi:MAG TPA: polyhydroxyalkanoic acid system family protein [Myxococcaceae bacterium]|nr:polyhydroxyalkanoic acid system family protein [Myxococcaceae bacterium]
MGKIDFQVPHTLSRAEAKKRMEHLTAHWAQHGIQATWAGDEAKLHGKVLGIHLDATLRVTDKTVGGEATDPGLLLRGQAKRYLTHKFATWLDPKKSIEELEKA